MKKLVAELMNHGFSENQALAFIGECYKEFERLNEIFKWPSYATEEIAEYCVNDITAATKAFLALNSTEKGVEDKYAAIDNETVGD